MPVTDVAQLGHRNLGRCVYCGRDLYNVESIEAFAGPICRSKHGDIVDRANTMGRNIDRQAFSDAMDVVLEDDDEPIDMSDATEACHAVLRILSRGTTPGKATVCLDAIMALGYTAVAYAAGQAMQVEDYMGASLSKDGSVSVMSERILVKGAYNSGAVAAMKGTKTRRWDALRKANHFEAQPSIAREVIALCARWYPFITIADEVLELAAKPEDSKAVIDVNKADAKVVAVGNNLELYVPYDQKFIAHLKELPIHQRKWSREKKCWIVDGAQQRYVIDLVLENWSWADVPGDVAERHQTAKKIAAMATAASGAEPIKVFGGELYPFQCVGVHALEEQERLHDGTFGMLLADDMGLGKTVQALVFMARNEQRTPALIVCPASVKINWARQARKWTDDLFTLHIMRGLYCYEVNGDGVTEKDAVHIRDYQPKKNHLLITNYDMISKIKSHITAFPFQSVVFDESHFLKNSKSGRSKAACYFSVPNDIGGQGINRRLLLTGTPVLNRPKELWHQLHMLDPGTWENFFTFAKRYCGAHKGRWGWDFDGQTHAEELRARLIGSYMIRRRKADVLTDLPKKTVYDTILDINSTDRSEYDFATDDFRSWAAGKGGAKMRAAEKAQAIVKLTTLRRLAAEAKVKTVSSHVCEWLDSNDKEGLVVFAHHREVIIKLEAALAKAKFTCVKIMGGDAIQKRQAAIDKFKAGEVRVILCSIMAAGVGVDGLQDNSSHMMFIERTWRPADHAQAEDRLHRIGQEQPVFIEYLDMANSIDGYLGSIISKKMKLIDKLVDGIGDSDDCDVSGDVLDAFLTDQD